jgi:hypothetical protein
MYSYIAYIFSVYGDFVVTALFLRGLLSLLCSWVVYFFDRCFVPGGLVVAALFLVVFDRFAIMILWSLICSWRFVVAALFLVELWSLLCSCWFCGRFFVLCGFVGTALFLLVLWSLLCSLWICWHCYFPGDVVVVVLFSWWYCGSCTLLLVVLW